MKELFRFQQIYQRSIQQFSADLSKTPDQVNILYVKKIQARKHHKNRINKNGLNVMGTKSSCLI